MRDDKEPQIVVNRARPMSDFADHPEMEEPERTPVQQNEGTLYLRLPNREDPLFGKVRAIFNMFPGNSQVVVYLADSKQRLGSSCSLDSRMLSELVRVLGQEKVVIK